MNIDASKIARTFGTHNGTFHADEVTACALLLLFDLIDRDKIIRTRDLEVLSKCEYVCDVGGVYEPTKKMFDHHQADYQGPMSSAGMILKYLLDTKFLKEKEYHFLNQTLIMGVDAHDNGRDPLPPGYSSFSSVVSNFTPIRYDCTPEEQDQGFNQALHFVKDHLKRLKDRFRYVQSCRKSVIDSMERSSICLVFEESLPWLDIFFELQGVKHSALFVIMPSGSHWKLRGIPPTYEDRMRVRVPLPAPWAGLLEEDLKKASGIPGAIFCHKGRFISVWETREDAFKALEYTLKYAEEHESDNNFWRNYQRQCAGGKNI